MIVSTNSTGPPLKDFDPHEQSPDLQSSQTRWPFDKVIVHGAKSLGGYFACLKTLKFARNRFPLIF